MAIKPDNREVLWYDVMNILKMPSDAVPSYWTTLIGTFRMLDDGNPRYICKTCNNQIFDMFEFKDKIYCSKGYIFKKEESGGDFKIVSIRKISKVNHVIVSETIGETLNRLLSIIFDMLEEVGGYKYDLLTLENALFGTPDDSIFETKYGDVPKRVVKNWLYQVEKVIRDRMMELRMVIRFESHMRTPPVKVM